MYFPELKRKLLIKTQNTMTALTRGATENNTAMSSPGLPRYSLHKAENSTTFPFSTKETKEVI